MARIPQRGAKQQPQGAILNTFAPVVSFEQIILEQVNAILKSPLQMSMLGDAANAAKSHAMSRELVQFFDDFVFSTLTIHLKDSKEVLKKYTDEREKIITEWAKSGDEMSCTHKLFRLTVMTLAQEHLFKMKQFSYFFVNRAVEDKSGLTTDDLHKTEQTED